MRMRLFAGLLMVVLSGGAASAEGYFPFGPGKYPGHGSLPLAAPVGPVLPRLWTPMDRTQRMTPVTVKQMSAAIYPYRAKRAAWFHRRPAYYGHGGTYHVRQGQTAVSPFACFGASPFVPVFPVSALPRTDWGCGY